MLHTTDTNFRQVRFGSNATILTAREAPISLEAIAANAPAVFAEGKHESRTDRYEFLNTRTVLEGLLREGFGVYEVRQGGSRIAGKREFTKHMLRLRYHGGDGNGFEVRRGDAAVPEVVITNAHDGTASWQLGAGMFRIICTNGLVGGELFEYQRVGHTKSAPDKVIDGVFRVVGQFEQLRESAQAAAGIELTDRQRLAFAAGVRELRWGGDTPAPVEPPRLLQPRREEDRLTDLWTTMNTLQENVIKGGIGYDRRNPETGRVSHRSTGEVRSIDDNTRLNRALWTMMDVLRGEIAA